MRGNCVARFSLTPTLSLKGRGERCVSYLWCSVLVALFLSPLVHAQEPKPLKVVATHSILGDWVTRVAGDKIALSVLVGPNGDAHTFEPTPQESVILAEADVIFENGLGFESWLNDLYASSGSKAERVAVTDGIDLIRFKTGERGDVDPHVWHSVKNAMIAVETITKTLIRKDSVDEVFFNEQARNYTIELQSLDEWIRREVTKIPATQRKLITSHDTFGYFAKEYGFDIIGAAIHSATTEASDPSAHQIAELIEKIQVSQVPAIFTENIHNPKLMAMIAQESNVKLAPTLYTDALGEPDSNGENYIHMMMYNVDVITRELSQ